MLKSIKTLIGKLTLPENVYVDSLGDYWVDCEWIPNKPLDYDKVFTYDGWKILQHRDYSHQFNYRSIEQNNWGKWVVGDMYLGKNTPLKKLGE